MTRSDSLHRNGIELVLPHPSRESAWAAHSPPEQRVKAGRRADPAALPASPSSISRGQFLSHPERTAPCWVRARSPCLTQSRAVGGGLRESESPTSAPAKSGVPLLRRPPSLRRRPCRG